MNHRKGGHQIVSLVLKTVEFDYHACVSESEWMGPATLFNCGRCWNPGEKGPSLFLFPFFPFPSLPFPSLPFLFYCSFTHETCANRK